MNRIICNCVSLANSTCYRRASNIALLLDRLYTPIHLILLILLLSLASILVVVVVVAAGKETLCNFFI